jgi:hypothetical protein
MRKENSIFEIAIFLRADMTRFKKETFKLGSFDLKHGFSQIHTKNKV